MPRRPKSGPTGREAIMEIDRRLGGLLGPLAEGLARVVDAAEKAGDAAGAPQDVTVETARGPVTVRAGYSVRVGGLAGAVRGAASPAAQPADAAPAEPAYDVFEGPDGWTLTAETPGAAPDSLRVRVEDGVLIAEAGQARRWRIAAPLPTWAAGLAPDARLMNGVLDVAIRRPEPAA